MLKRMLTPGLCLKEYGKIDAEMQITNKSICRKRSWTCPRYGKRTKGQLGQRSDKLPELWKVVAGALGLVRDWRVI